MFQMDFQSHNHLVNSPSHSLWCSLVSSIKNINSEISDSKYDIFISVNKHKTVNAPVTFSVILL